MTKELHLKLIAAWWDGELEFLYADCGWKPANRSPHSESDLARYRIRPKPTLRPWKPEEVPVGAVLQYKTSAPAKWVIQGAFSCGVLTYLDVCGHFQSLQLATTDWSRYHYSLDNGKTWLECGILEESQ